MITQKTDQSQDSERFSNIGKSIRKKKLTQFMIIIAMFILTNIFNIFLEKFVQTSFLVFVCLVPAMAGGMNFGTWASASSFAAGFLAFDFMFMKPYSFLHISNPQDVYNVTICFVVAVLITYLIYAVHRQNAFLRSRLDRLSLLEYMSRNLLLLTPMEQTYSIGNITLSLRTAVFNQLGQLTLRYAKMIVDAPALVFFREDGGSLNYRV